jgi:hypothetical protein
MMRELEIVAGSWPIAIMVVVLIISASTWSLVRRGMKNNTERERMKLHGSNALVVQGRERLED